MKLLGKRLHVKRVLDEVQVGSFVLVGSCRDMNPLFEVLSVGDIEDIHTGDKVVCKQYSGRELGDNEYIMEYDDVLCVAEDD